MAIQRAKKFTVAGTGDAIITRQLTPYEGVTDRFDQLLHILRGADATVTNLEVLIHDYEGYPSASSGGTYMRAPPYSLEELSEMGIDLYSAATNHTFDFSHGGIEATIDNLESRGLPFAGLGRNLYEARRPVFLETAAGRVAMVSTCTSITSGAEAGEQSPALRGRPGLNPLNVERRYRLPDSKIESLREISDIAGIEAMKQSWLERGLYHNRDWNQDEFFHFGNMKFESVSSECEAGVGYAIKESDRMANIEWIEEARTNADWVIATIHSHQGVGGLQNTPETPKFLVEFAHDVIDAGADAVIAHGPHILRGVEVYEGAPICYSLGNFIVQNETVGRLPPESFRRYGLEDSTKVSDVFNARLYEEDRQIGDLANEAFWETVVPEITFGPNGLEQFVLHPVTLQRESGRPQRGIPVLAVDEDASSIIGDIAQLSEQFATSIEQRGDIGIVER